MENKKTDILLYLWMFFIGTGFGVLIMVILIR